MSIIERQVTIPEMQSFFDKLELGDLSVSPIKTDDLSWVKLLDFNDTFANIVPSTWTLDGHGNLTDPRRWIRLTSLNELDPIRLDGKTLKATRYYIGFGQYNCETRCFTTTEPKEATHIELNCFFDMFNQSVECHEDEYFRGQIERFEYDNPSGHKYDLQQRYIIEFSKSEWAYTYRIKYSTKLNDKLLGQHSKLVDYATTMVKVKAQIRSLQQKGLFEQYGCTCEMGEFCYFVTNSEGERKKLYYLADKMSNMLKWLIGNLED